MKKIKINETKHFHLHTHSYIIIQGKYKLTSFKIFKLITEPNNFPFNHKFSLLINLNKWSTIPLIKIIKIILLQKTEEIIIRLKKEFDCNNQLFGNYQMNIYSNQFLIESNFSVYFIF